MPVAAPPARARRPWRDPIVVALLMVINSLVLFNAIRHSPFVGYDALAHLSYIGVLAGGQLPGPEDTAQFFAAPLPYLVPALAGAFATDRWGVVVKLAQLQNVAWSIGLTLVLVRLCAVMRPGDLVFARWSLLLLATMPVYYKTFAFVRGEPLAAFLAVLAVERVLTAALEPRTTSRGWMMVGVVFGALLLAKQWGVFVTVAAALWLAREIAQAGGRRQALIRGAALAATVAILVSGWFYFSLYQRFGSVAAFNTEAADQWSFANRPAAFYMSHGLPLLFTDPVRERFALGEHTTLLPVWYADFWGDYWGYWAVRAEDPEGGWASGTVLASIAATNPAASNRDTIAPYLGRVNAVAIAPTLLALAGLLVGLVVTGRWLLGRGGSLDPPEPTNCSGGTALVVLATLVSVAGYLYLLVGYPELDVKASYLLQIVPLVALLAGAAVAPLARTHSHWHRLAVGVVVAAGLHHAPLYVTRFPW